MSQEATNWSSLSGVIIMDTVDNLAEIPLLVPIPLLTNSYLFTPQFTKMKEYHKDLEKSTISGSVDLKGKGSLVTLPNT